jgi:hypothetical protein
MIVEIVLKTRYIHSQTIIHDNLPPDNILFPVMRKFAVVIAGTAFRPLNRLFSMSIRVCVRLMFIFLLLSVMKMRLIVKAPFSHWNHFHDIVAHQPVFLKRLTNCEGAKLLGWMNGRPIPGLILGRTKAQPPTMLEARVLASADR